MERVLCYTLVSNYFRSMNALKKLLYEQTKRNLQKRGRTPNHKRTWKFIIVESSQEIISTFLIRKFNPLNAEFNPICYLLALLGAHHFLHVSRIRVKSLILRLLMLYIYMYIYIYIYIYIYGAPILDVSRSHTTTHRSR